MHITSYDPHEMDSNQILNSIDRLLSEGHDIDDIVSSMDALHVISNYDLLRRKGVKNIHLSELKDKVAPIVILNNFRVFEDVQIPVDYSKIIATLDDEDALNYLPTLLKTLLDLEVDPQLIADKCMASDGNVMDFFQEALPTLLDLGVKVDGDKLIDKLLVDEALMEDYSDDIDTRLLVRAGASEASLAKLRNYLDQHTYYAPTLDELSINMEGRQTTKLFFHPQIQLFAKDGGKELDIAWSGRILPGQTLKEGIAAELKEVYGYTGRFDFRNVYFLDYAKDNKGQDIERYGLYIALYPTELDTLKIG
jgi:hypothetical protein